jgi:hypothetical protein
MSRGIRHKAEIIAALREIRLLAGQVQAYVDDVSDTGTARLTATMTVNFAAGASEVTTSTGDHMSTSMTVDNTSVSVVVLPEDDHGDTTPDQLVWSSDDPNGAVLTPSISADTHTWTGVPVAEGTVNLSAVDPTAPDLAPFTAQIVVEAGATSQLAGTVTVNP